MPYPRLSSRRERKLINITGRLLALFEALGDDSVRRSRLLPPATAGAWRRTLSEAATLLGTQYVPDSHSRRPVDFFVATVANVHALTGLKRLQDKASRPKSRWSYPRSSSME